MDELMDGLIKKAAHDLARAKNIAALTGAGISVESGIPPFRGKGGLWEKIDPMEFAHIDSFMKDPVAVWHGLLKEMRDLIDKAQPNDAHNGLAKLEQLKKLKTIITQNVDGLHQLAGNSDVIEFHGNFVWQRCMECNNRCKTSAVDLSCLPPKCSCGGIYRPDCVFFGEMIDPDHLVRSQQAASTCDVMLVIGTSAVVQPAAYMPVIAKENGAKIIEINPEKTPLTNSISDYIVMGTAGRTLKGIVDQLEHLIDS
jgi:NAD-dependent deacetylase